MKRVALIAYWYPPHNVVGALRAAKLAKYLPEFGWAPLVVTVDPRGVRALDPPLVEEPLTEGAVVRTRDRSLHAWIERRLVGSARAAALEPFTFDSARASGRSSLAAAHWLYRHVVAFPDEVWPWRFEYARIREAVARNKVHAVISTSPPATTHMLASRLARDLGVPWAADFRDPWTSRSSRRRLAPLDALERRMERRVLARAQAIVTVSEPLARDLAALHGKPVTVVPNGFDPADAVSVSADRRVPLDPGRFTLVHTGTLLHDTRDPRPFFTALERVLLDGALGRDSTEVWLLGRNLEVARRALADTPALAPLLRFETAVARDVALAAQRDATILLVLEAPRAEHAGVVTGKVFEYLAAERPVLAFGPRGGALDALLQETRGGVLVTTADEAAAALLHWACEFRSTGRVAWTGDREAVRRYDRRSLAGRWAQLLDRLHGTADQATALPDAAPGATRR